MTKWLIRVHALDILIKFQKDNLAEKENWKMVKDYLLKMCEPKTKQRDYRNELDNIKHTGEFEMFVHKFMAVAIKLEKMTDSELLHVCLRALNKDMRFKQITNLKIYQKNFNTKNLFNLIKFRKIINILMI